MVEAQRIRKGREEGCLETARGYLFRDPVERSIVAAILIAPPRPLWVTCGRRPGKNFLTCCSIGRVRSRVRPVDAARVAAGPNALRGSGPNRFHALGMR